jgi:hypothetical protein
MSSSSATAYKEQGNKSYQSGHLSEAIGKREIFIHGIHFRYVFTIVVAFNVLN